MIVITVADSDLRLTVAAFSWSSDVAGFETKSQLRVAMDNTFIENLIVTLFSLIATLILICVWHGFFVFPMKFVEF